MIFKLCMFSIALLSTIPSINSMKRAKSARIENKKSWIQKENTIFYTYKNKQNETIEAMGTKNDSCLTLTLYIDDLTSTLTFIKENSTIFISTVKETKRGPKIKTTSPETKQTLKTLLESFKKI